MCPYFLLDHSYFPIYDLRNHFYFFSLSQKLKKRQQQNNNSIKRRRGVPRYQKSREKHSYTCCTQVPNFFHCECALKYFNVWNFNKALTIATHDLEVINCLNFCISLSFMCPCAFLKNNSQLHTIRHGVYTLTGGLCVTNKPLQSCACLASLSVSPV